MRLFLINESLKDTTKNNKNNVKKYSVSTDIFVQHLYNPYYKLNVTGKIFSVIYG